jgi:hypothetical protein
MFMKDTEAVAQWLADHPNLEELNVSLGELRKLPPLPAGLKRLKLERLRHLRRIPKLPLGLEELTVSNCDKLRHLPKLPRFLEKLVLHRNELLQGLASIPPNMEEIEISCCPGMKQIPAIPRWVNKVTILVSPALEEAAARANFFVAPGQGALYFSQRNHPLTAVVRDKADSARITY